MLEKSNAFGNVKNEIKNNNSDLKLFDSTKIKIESDREFINFTLLCNSKVDKSFLKTNKININSMLSNAEIYVAVFDKKFNLGRFIIKSQNNIIFYNRVLRNKELKIEVNSVYRIKEDEFVPSDSLRENDIIECIGAILLYKLCDSKNGLFSGYDKILCTYSEGLSKDFIERNTL